MNIGTTLEAAAWYDPANPKAEAGTKQSLIVAMNEYQDWYAVRLGAFRWTTLAPGDERVPAPPNAAPNGVKLMHVEADVIALAPSAARFSADLEHGDLETLRKATRHARPHDNLTDVQCDAIIDDLGPTVAEAMLRQAIGSMN